MDLIYISRFFVHAPTRNSCYYRNSNVLRANKQWVPMLPCKKQRDAYPEGRRLVCDWKPARIYDVVLPRVESRSIVSSRVLDERKEATQLPGARSAPREDRYIELKSNKTRNPAFGNRGPEQTMTLFGDFVPEARGAAARTMRIMRYLRVERTRSTASEFTFHGGDGRRTRIRGKEFRWNYTK